MWILRNFQERLLYRTSLVAVSSLSSKSIISSLRKNSFFGQCWQVFKHTLKTSLFSCLWNVTLELYDSLLINLFSQSFYLVFSVIRARLYWFTYFPVFSPYTGKYGPEKALYLDIFHVVKPLPKTSFFYEVIYRFQISCTRDHMFSWIH